MFVWIFCNPTRENNKNEGGWHECKLIKVIVVKWLWMVGKPEKTMPINQIWYESPEFKNFA